MAVASALGVRPRSRPCARHSGGRRPSSYSAGVLRLAGALSWPSERVALTSSGQSGLGGARSYCSPPLTLLLLPLSPGSGAQLHRLTVV